MSMPSFLCTYLPAWLPSSILSYCFFQVMSFCHHLNLSSDRPAFLPVSLNVSFLPSWLSEIHFFSLPSFLFLCLLISLYFCRLFFQSLFQLLSCLNIHTSYLPVFSVFLYILAFLSFLSLHFLLYFTSFYLKNRPLLLCLFKRGGGMPWVISWCNHTIIPNCPLQLPGAYIFTTSTRSSKYTTRGNLLIFLMGADYFFGKMLLY